MRPKQTLLLGLLLLVPVLAFLFLKSFGTNRYALPTFLPDRVDSTRVGGEWQRDTVFHQVSNFRLTSQAGQPITERQLGNGLYVASFLCADCSWASTEPVAQLMRVQEAFRREPRVKLVTFLTSGTTPQAAAEQYGAIAGKWWFLTSDKPTLQQIATEDYQLQVTGAAIQTPTLFLVDRDRRVRGVYDGTKTKEIDRLLTEISVLLYMYEHDNSRR